MLFVGIRLLDEHGPGALTPIFLFFTLFNLNRGAVETSTSEITAAIMLGLSPVLALSPGSEFDVRWREGWNPKLGRALLSLPLSLSS